MLQEKQIEEEEKKLEAERAAMIAALRDQLTEDTRYALANQEQHLSQLLARLQVGQARRQALILRQDKTIQELEVSAVERDWEIPDL